MRKSLQKVVLGAGLLLGLVYSEAGQAQRRPPRQKPNTTAESIEQTESAQDRRRREEQQRYDEDRGRHLSAQSKATRRRMKRNQKRSIRKSRNRMLPWWRRVFSRKRYD